MLRWIVVFLMVCGLAAHADVKIWDDPDCKVYAIQDASDRFPATLFTSVDPQERFVQTASSYDASVNVFIVEFKNNPKRIMIDTGFGVPKGKLLTEMEKAGIPPESISDILITHIHPDHVGGLPDFQNAKVHIAKDEYEAWTRDASRQALAKCLQEAKSLDLFAYDTEVVPNLTAIKLAGHTPGHTVFRQKDRYFVGDLVHAADLQIKHPSFCARYDMNPQEAAAGRKKALHDLHGEWFGAHIPFPGRFTNP